MDGVSSAFSVVSLAIQLGENIKNIVEFGKAVEDAPARICALFHDLEVLESVISQIHRTSSRIEFDAVTEAVLKNCKRKVSILHEKIQPALLKFKSDRLASRKWSAFKITLKKEEIQSLRVSIEEAKSTLQLVQNNSLLELLFSTVQSQSKVVVGIEILSSVVQQSLTQKVGCEASRMHIHHLNDTCDEACTPGLQTKPSSGATSAIEEIISTSCHTDLTGYSNNDLTRPFRSFDFQVRHTRSTRRLDVTTPFVGVQTRYRTRELRTVRSSEAHETSETDVICVVYPNAGGKLLGITYGMLLSAKSTSGWQFSIQPFRAVPENSLIFEFCRQGNLEGVRTLLQRNEASPWDRDPTGQTPLWVASQSLQLDVAKLLLNEGADPHARSWKNSLEPIFAITHSKTIEMDPKLAMINLLQSYRREDYDDDTTLQIVGQSMIQYRPQKDIQMPWAQRCEAVHKLVSTLMPMYHPDDPNRAKVVFTAVQFYYEQEILHSLLRSTKPPLDGSSQSSTIHEAIHRRLLERDIRSMKLIVQKTRNLHLLAQRGFLQIEMETPTMLAMYDMATFMLWRQILRELGYDMQKFVRRELEGLLRQAGWTESSLAYLFNIEIPPDPHTARIVFGFPCCQRCERDGVGLTSKLMVDLKWRRRLRDIRKRFSGNSSEIMDESASKTCAVGDSENTAIPADCSSTKSTNEELRGTSSATSIETGPSAAAALPSMTYRIVCSDSCRDGICIAWVCEDESNDEPEFPPYPCENPLVPGDSVQNTTSEGLVVESCPTHGMPGAFRD